MSEYFRRLQRINKKLPTCKQKVIANYSTLPYTINLGCRAEIDHNYDHTDYTYFLINDRKIYVGAATTELASENVNDIRSLYIGQGILFTKKTNHINSVWADAIWKSEYGAEAPSLSSRQGWCCTMSKQKPHRDMVCDVIIANHMKELDKQNYWFCYDGMKDRDALVDFMFRKPSRKISDRDIVIVDSASARNNKHNLRGKLGPWHYNSLIELAPESDPGNQYFEITEKTLKAINARMPFVSIACHKYLYRLKKLGFKTFSPYIDESYDNEPDNYKRTEMAVASLFKFVNNPTHLDEIQKICDHNYNIYGKIRKHSSDRTTKKIKHLITF